MNRLISAFALISIIPASYAEEIVVPKLPPTFVTGDIWDSQLQQTTASVTVIEEDTLKYKGNQHFEDVINTIPNLTWTGGTSRPRYIQIRGIGENSQFEGETPDSSVRFLIDDLDLTGLGTVGNLFDVKQIEVLRGPQAGAFGANAAGGMIKIVTNDPTPYWNGQTETTLGNDNLKSAGIAIGGPLIKEDPKKLSFRLAAHQLRQDGFRKNKFLNLEDTNKRDELTTRMKLRWFANEYSQIDGQIFFADSNNGYDEFELSNNSTNTYSDEPGQDLQETRGANLRWSYSGHDKIDFSYTTQYNTTNSTYSYDSDWGAGYLSAFGTPAESGYFGFLSVGRDRDINSQELRLDSKEKQEALGFIDRWTVGLHHHKLDEFSDINYRDEFALGVATSDYETESVSYFTQIAHDLSNSTRFILGLRYEYHEVDFNSIVTEDYFGSLNTGTPDVSKNSSVWGGKITLERDVNNEQMLFASVTKGYKVGGANSGAFILPTDPTTYDDETLWNYELGLRSKWLSGKASSQITLFHLKREDAQLRDSAGAGGFFRYFTSNQGKAQHTGLEAESTWYITGNWTAKSSLGVLDTKLNKSGRDLSNSPDLTYSARLDYLPPLGIFAALELVGSDEYYVSNSHNEKRGSTLVVNSSIGYQFDNWTITLWAKNLLNRKYEERVFLFDNYDPDGLGEQRYESFASPRTFGVTANYKW